MPPNTPQLLFEKKAHGDVRQDKIAKSRDHIASGQPAAPQRGPRPQLKSNFGNHEKLPPAPGDRTVPLTLHVRPIVKDRIREIADLEGLKSPDSPPSLSVIGSRYLERGLQEHMDMQYGALLEPMLKKILDKNQQQRKRCAGPTWLPQG
jgi:hypothetical protein